jgi:hypothetical protein
MPSLEDIVQKNGMQQEEPTDGFDGTEKAVGEETIQNLKAQVDAMQVDANEPRAGGHKGRGHNLEPIIQFPEEEGQNVGLEVNANVLEQLKTFEAASRQGPFGPRQSDMIPALRGLSHLQVSFGSATDVSMAFADSVLGKRPAGEEEEVQGAALDLSLGLTYGGMAEGAP